MNLIRKTHAQFFLRTNAILKMVLPFLGAIVAMNSPGLGAPVPADDEEISATPRTDVTEPASEFMITTWRTSEGLPVNEVHELRETPDGYLWIGSHRGLVRFDGKRFESFFDTPTGRRFGARAGPLEIDDQGHLWIAPDEVGLIRRDSDGYNEVLTNETVLKARAVSLCSYDKKIMWVDANGGLGQLSIEQPNQAQQVKGGGASSASHWLRDFGGKLWLVNSRSLKIYEEGKWLAVPAPGGPSTTFKTTQRRAGGLWIVRDAKLWFLTADGSSREVASVPWAGQSRVICLLEDSHERVWIGTIDQGIFCFSSGAFKHVMPLTSSIVSLLEDSQENIWAGTRGSGLVRIQERHFFMHDLRSGLQNEYVRSLAPDKDGRVWMLTAEGGLGWWQNGSWHRQEQPEGWPGYDSTCVLPKSNGSVWISTVRHGVWRFSSGKFSRVKLGGKAPKEPVMDLMEDRRKRLWMVTDNSGIFCFETNKLSEYSTRNGLPSALIRRVVEDEAGEIWAGDWKGGIARFRTNVWEIVRKPSGHSDAVRSIVSADGALWIGTSAGGLLRVKNGRTTRISVEEGLPDACIQQLLLDGKGSLWGGTPHTLFRISLEQLNEVAEGRRQKLDAITYGRSDGLPDVSFANWCDPRCCLARNGELWFATANGAIHFQPEDLHGGQPPHVLLEQTLFDGKPVSSSTLQHLRPQQGRLEFRFTAPCLTGSERVRFRYQMTGVDSDWVDAGTARTATYASMPAGRHVFRVLASSPEGAWSSVPASMTLAVHPFFWQTNWFFAVLAAIFAGGAVWIVRRATVRRLNIRLERLRQQRAVDKERTRIAQDIHDELGANLTSIGLLADLGTRHKFDPSAVSRELGQISQTARESVSAMDAIVWALNPRNDSLDHFANYVSQFTREFFRPTQLRTRLDLPANLPAYPLATETRHQLFLIVKESFNNIVRHAQATEVNLKLTCENERLHLVISDNGKGLGATTACEGHDGLTNLHERIQRLGGTLRIESKHELGTRLEFFLPLTKWTRKKLYAD